MKKYIMNKAVVHDGQMYVKGSELLASHKGFESLVKDGHADELIFSDSKASVEPQQMAEAPEVQSRKSRK